MEAFSLLKYWRGGATTSSSAVHGGSTTSSSAVHGGSTTAVAVTSPRNSDNSDEGPFFDLELSVPLDTGSNGSTGSPGSDQNEPDPEPVQPGSGPDPVHNGFSRLKSATNFRVLLLKLKKNGDKAAKPETGKSSSSSSSNKFFTIKFKVEEIPTRSVFKRDNSSSSKPRTGTKNERRFSKDAIMQRYLKMVSKRYGGGGEKFSDEAEVAEEGGRRRRDDSLVQQQDGIQSAILHCKKSFNSSRDAEMSILSRSVSDPSQKCWEEFKENGF